MKLKSNDFGTILSGLRRYLQQFALQNPENQISRAFHKFEKDYAKRNFHRVEIICYNAEEKRTNDLIETIRKCISSEGGGNSFTDNFFSPIIYSYSEYLNVSFIDFPAAITFVYLQSCRDQALLNKTIQRASYNKALFVVIFDEHYQLEDIKEIVNERANCHLIISIDDFLKKSTNESLFFLSNQAILDQLFQLHNLIVLSRIIESYVLFLSQEIEEQQIKQLASIQISKSLKAKLIELQKSQLFLETTELIDRNFQLFEKAFNYRQMFFNKKHSESLLVNLEALFETMPTLCKTKKGQKYLLTVNEMFLQAIIERVNDSIKTSFENDLKEFESHCMDINNMIQKHLGTQNIPFKTFIFKQFQKEKFEKLFESNLQFDREYEGEMRRMLFQSLYYGARRPLIFLSLISWVLAPLGLGLSFGNNYNPLLFAAIVSILILSIGYVYFQTKADTSAILEKETKNAVKTLRSNIITLTQNFARDWERLLKEHLKEQRDMVVLHYNIFVKDYLSNEFSKTEDEFKKNELHIINTKENIKEYTNDRNNAETLYVDVNQKMNQLQFNLSTQIKL